MRLAFLLLLTLVLPFAWAGSKEVYSDATDATGWNTQKKMARAEDGAVFYAYVVGAADGSTDVAVVRERGGSLEELPRVKGALGNLTRPSLTLATDGALVLAWTERADEDREVFAARYADGSWHDITKLSDGLGYAGFPSLAAGPDGAVHVAWYGFDGTNYQTFVREWRDGAWSPAVQLSNGPLDANNPSVVVDEEGNAHVAWYKDEGRRFSIWYARKPLGAPWELPMRLPDGGGDALNVALATTADGRVHAAWDETDASGTRVLYNARGADGAWGDPVALASGPEAGEYPALARFQESVLVVWSDAAGTLRGTRVQERALTAMPILGGVRGENPSLRGPQPFPAGDRAQTLDLLFATPEGEIRHVAFAGCSPFEAGDGCPPPIPSRDVPASFLPVALLALLVAAGARRQALRMTSPAS